jgi:hypothetical protein
VHAVMGALLMLAHLGCDGFASTFQVWANTNSWNVHQELRKGTVA